MSIISLLLETFLKPGAPKPILGRILGYAFLVVAVILALYFLFQGLVPVIGYLQSGAVMCVIFTAAGLALLLVEKPKKKPGPIDKLVDKATADYKRKQENVEHIVKEDAPNLIMHAAVAGLTLYQIIKSLRKK